MVYVRLFKDESLVNAQTWGCGMRPGKGEASAVNTITVIVGHVSEVPVAHVAPRLRFLPPDTVRTSENPACIGLQSGGMRVTERL